jgi:hypothetical protein
MGLNHRWKMSNNDFEDFLNQMYQTGMGGGYKPGSSNPYSARNKAIEDLIKSITEQAEKYCDEVDQKRKGKHKPKFTDEEFNKTCEELGLVEDK